jgi:serine/threonine protein kinase
MNPLNSTTPAPRAEPVTLRLFNTPLVKMAKLCLDTIRSLTSIGLEGVSVRVVNKTGEVKTKVFIIGNKVFEVSSKKRDRLKGAEKEEREINLYDWSYENTRRDSILLVPDPVKYIAFKNNPETKLLDENRSLPLLREWDILTGYQNVPSIAKVVGYFSYPERRDGKQTGKIREMIVMPRYPRTLDKLVISNPQQAEKIFGQLAEGVAEIHRRGAVHRDLKPQNILVDDLGGVAITDFGYYLESSIQQTLRFSGSPRQIAPECVNCAYKIKIKKGQPFSEEEMGALWREVVKPANDVWALGVIIYELTLKGGSHQFPSSLKDAIFYEHKDPKTDFSNSMRLRMSFNRQQFFPEPADKNSVEHLVWCMLNEDPTQRITMPEVLDRLRQIKEKRRAEAAASPLLLARRNSDNAVVREAISPIWKEGALVATPPRTLPTPHYPGRFPGNFVQPTPPRSDSRSLQEESPVGAAPFQPSPHSQARLSGSLGTFPQSSSTQDLVSVSRGCPPPLGDTTPTHVYGIPRTGALPLIYATRPAGN